MEPKHATNTQQQPASQEISAVWGRSKQVCFLRFSISQKHKIADVAIAAALENVKSEKELRREVRKERERERMNE